MTDTIIHVGDVGTIFRITIVENNSVTPVNVSGATVKTIHFQKGDGTRVSKTAVFYTDGSDGIIQYVGIAADVDVAGTWQMQGYVEMPSGKFYSEIATFKVRNNISPTA
jgi:hypothetical protein